MASLDYKPNNTDQVIIDNKDTNDYYDKLLIKISNLDDIEFKRYWNNVILRDNIKEYNGCVVRINELKDENKCCKEDIIKLENIKKRYDHLKLGLSVMVGDEPVIYYDGMDKYLNKRQINILITTLQKGINDIENIILARKKIIKFYINMINICNSINKKNRQSANLYLCECKTLADDVLDIMENLTTNNRVFKGTPLQNGNVIKKEGCYLRWANNLKREYEINKYVVKLLTNEYYRL